MYIVLIIMFTLYSKRGKIRWAKLSGFCPMKFFTGKFSQWLTFKTLKTTLSFKACPIFA